jgi:hypothetical protein
MKREEQEEHNEQWRERHLQLALGRIDKLNSTITALLEKGCQPNTFLGVRRVSFRMFK